MAAADAAVLLAKLEQCFEKIKELFAWRQLKREEARPGLPPSFIMDDHVEEDLRNAYSRFTATADQLCSILNNNRLIIPTTQRAYIKERLWQLDRRLRSLNLPAYLYPVDFCGVF